MMVPSLDLLMEISYLLPSREECVQLSEQLDLGADFVELVKAGLFTTNLVAMNIFCKWRQMKAEAATGKVLSSALSAIGRQDVAACFAKQLTGKGEKTKV